MHTIILEHDYLKQPENASAKVRSFIDFSDKIIDKTLVGKSFSSAYFTLSNHAPSVLHQKLQNFAAPACFSNTELPVGIAEWVALQSIIS